MEASVLIMHLASPAARLLCILGQTAKEHASSKRQGLGGCPRRFWQEPQDAEPHGLPVPTGDQHISPGLPCASPGHWSPFSFLHIFPVSQHAMCAQAGLHVEVIAFAGSKPIHAVAHNQRITLHAIPEP